VFQRSSQEFAAHGVALEGNQAQAVALCEELERIAALTGEPLLAAANQLDGLRNQFDSLDLPRPAARDLRQRARQANDRCVAAIRREREAAARRAWADIFAAAAQVQAWSLAHAQCLAPADCEALHALAATAVSALEHAPKGARAFLERRMSDVEAGTVNADLAANEAALRLLCVRAELITETPTPPEDLELRREYQMQRLVASMGRGERATPADLDDLALEWLAVGPVEAALYEALAARFRRCHGYG
jgi:hypothetical protein